MKLVRAKKEHVLQLKNLLHIIMFSGKKKKLEIKLGMFGWNIFVVVSA